MLGAIVGDIVGSTREGRNVKTENFELIPRGSRFTDDSMMTLAVAEWLMYDPDHRAETLVMCMQQLGRRYPYAGYGGSFFRWLMSSHPEPYGSYGNGSAMRVSPVGLYAGSLDEALELARITASVSHNHPEGIKGAQAIAACVFLRKNTDMSADEMKRFVEDQFGYDLSFNMAELRRVYRFDVSCQGSVPVAIKAFIERADRPAEDALRLAISMGGDSDTIGAMTASIACAQKPGSTGGGFGKEVEAKCRVLLPADLLDINDRFEAFVGRPLGQSFFVGEKLIAGEYPGAKRPQLAELRLRRMMHFGVRHFVDLTCDGELYPYSHLLTSDCSYLRLPMRSMGVPQSVDEMHRLVDEIERLTRQEGYTYVHSYCGAGRTGLVTACYEARQMRDATLEKVIDAVSAKFANMPKSARCKLLDGESQLLFLGEFVKSCWR